MTFRPLFDAPAPNEPFCAGVLITDAGRVLFAVGDRDDWIHTPHGLTIPVGGIGGGQEPGEMMPECARREAREEIGCEVELRHSPLTYVDDGRGLSSERFVTAPAPFLYQLQPRKDPRPFAPGLPAGELLHVVWYKCNVKGDPRPLDVVALLWVPIRALECLVSGIPADKINEHGIELLIDKPLGRGTLLQIPAGGTEAMLCHVVAHYGANALG